MDAMLKTIMIGTCVLVQGVFAGTLANGFMRVRVGNKVYCGRPVMRHMRPAA